MILGSLLALVIAATEYFNTELVRQASLADSYLPVGAYGTLIILLLAVNPLLRAIVPPWSLSGRELAVVTALATAGCVYPGMGLMIRFVPLVAWPSHAVRAEPAWQSARLLSYVPGGRPEVAPGHVADWPALASTLRALAASDAEPADRWLWTRLTKPTRQALLRLSDSPEIGASERDLLLHALDELVRDPQLLDHAGLYERLPDALRTQIASARDASIESDVLQWNRQAIAELWPHLILPAPEGAGLLLDARASPGALDELVVGRSEANWDPRSVPWRAWWPTLRLWGAIVVTMTMLGGCIALVVHEPWSRHERLAYPLVRFATETTAMSRSGWLPAVATTRTFWSGMLIAAGIHSLAELNAYFPALPAIPLQFDLTPLKELFPTAARVPGHFGVFEPRIVLVVLAFAFFLPTDISFSLGIGPLLWMLMGTAMLSYGIPVQWATSRPQPVTLINIGTWFGAAIMILYFGRRYYLGTLCGAIGLGRAAAVSPAAVWGMRGLFIFSAALVLVLTAGAGLDWSVAAPFVGLVVMLHVIVARMTAEAGLFVAHAGWLPLAAFSAIYGDAAVGPTAAIVLTLASAMVLRFELITPMLVNALRLGESGGGVRPARLAPALAGVAVAGLGVAACATLVIQYNTGLVSMAPPGARHWAGEVTKNPMLVIGELAAKDRLHESLSVQGWRRLEAIEPDPQYLIWVTSGLAVFVVVSLARLRIPRWPLHPIVFLFWGQYVFFVYGLSFLLGWMVKASVVGVGGRRGYDVVKPMMIGLIGGTLASTLVWSAIGISYWMSTGHAPARA